jgi:hypothetical protein
MVSLIDHGIAAWPLPQEEQTTFREMSEKEPWARMTRDEIEGKIAAELGQHPFGDVGADRSVIWSAFGVLWIVRSVADEDTWFAALELAGAIQIVQAEFADLDLLIIPSRVFIDVRLDDGAKPHCVQLPDNGKLTWQVTMPKAMTDTPTDGFEAYLVSVVLTIVGQATALSFPKLREMVEKRMERGLPGRVFSVRPLRELMKLVQPDNLDFAKLASDTRPVLRSDFQPIEAAELAWRTGPGPGYSRSLAERYLLSRYEKTTRGLRMTLPRIVKDSGCRRLLLRMRSEGNLDWQILNALLNIVAQWQVETKLGHLISTPSDSQLVIDRVFREEQDDDPPFDLSVMTKQRFRMQLKLGIPAAFSTWGLTSHRQTPDFDAMKRLLDERYQHSADDIPHPDPFA